MAGAENPIQVLTQKFDEAIYGLKDSNVEGVNQMALRCVDRIRNGELLVMGNNRVFAIPSVTGFSLMEIPFSMRQMYIPAIVIDIPKVLAASDEALKGDLARTVAVADQSPDKGYQRRLRVVYQEPLEAQANFLDETRTPPIDFDPRGADRADLIRELIGDARYYSDTGFDDWQKAIRDYCLSEQDPSILPILDQLQENVGHFVSVRQRYTPMNYQAARQAVGERYITGWDEEKRAEVLVYALMGASVFARMPSN